MGTPASLFPEEFEDSVGGSADPSRVWPPFVLLSDRRVGLSVDRLRLTLRRILRRGVRFLTPDTRSPVTIPLQNPEKLIWDTPVCHFLA